MNLFQKRRALFKPVLLTCLTFILGTAGHLLTAQYSPVPSASQTADTITRAREAYELEVDTAAAYEAALKTGFLRDEANSLAERYGEEHRQNAERLFNLLNDLGAKPEKIKPVKKNYNRLVTEHEALAHLIKYEDTAEKMYSGDARKAHPEMAKRLFAQCRDDARARLKSLAPLLKSAAK